MRLNLSSSRIYLHALVMAIMVGSLPFRAFAQTAPAGQPRTQELTLEQKERLKERDRYGEETTKLRSEGKLQEAIAACEKMLAIEREVFGNEHDDVAGSLQQLAEMHEEREEFDAARKVRGEALTIATKLYGEKDWRATNARLAVGTTGRLAEMKPEQRSRLAEARQMNSQVERLYQQGKAREAVSLAQKALEIRREVLGAEHRDTAASLNNLGAQLQAIGQYESARLSYEQALAIQEKVLGEEHPETALSLNNIGSLHYSMGQYEAARSYFEQALPIFKKVLGEEHPLAATSLNNLGNVFQAMGQYEAARPYHEQALAIRKKALGEEHPDTALSLNNLGLLLQAIGQHEAARPFHEQALAIQEKVLGEEHRETALSLNNLGYLLRAMDQHEAARSYYEQALAIHKKVLGEEHPDTALSLNNLGAVLVTMGQYEAARPYYEQALAINKKVLGDEHAHTAMSLNNLGYVLQAMGQSEAARPYVDQALAIFKKVLGEEHPHTALSLHNLGYVQLAVRDYAGARELFENALFIKLRLAGNVLPTLAETEALNYAEVNQSGRDPLLSVLSYLPERRDDQAYAAVWNTRGLVSRAVAARRPPTHPHPLSPQAPQAGSEERVSGSYPEADRLWEALRWKRAELAKLILAVPPPEKAQARQEKLSELTAEKERLERDLAEASATFRRQREVEEARFSDLAARLPRGVALLDVLETTLSEPPTEGEGKLAATRHYEAFVLRKTESQPGYSIAWVHLGPAEPINQAVRDWRRELSPSSVREAHDDPDRGSANNLPPDQRLRRLIWEPIEPQLAGCSAVVVIPDSELTAVPWAALPGRTAGSSLWKNTPSGPSATVNGSMTC